MTVREVRETLALALKGAGIAARPVHSLPGEEKLSAPCPKCGTEEAEILVTREPGAEPAIQTWCPATCTGGAGWSTWDSPASLAGAYARTGASRQQGAGSAQAAEPAGSVAGKPARPDKPTRFSYGDLLMGEPPQVEWLVEGLVPRHGVTILGGDAGVGKSWVALHLAQCVASGLPFLGRFPTMQGPVVMIDEEQGEGLVRARLFKAHRGLGVGADLPITFSLGEAFRLDESPEVVAAVLEAHRPSLVTWDSLVRAHGADENKSQEMAAVLANARRLERDFDTAFFFLHHLGKPGPFQRKAGERLRGSSDIRAFADSVLVLTEVERGLLLVEHDKCRHAEPQPKFHLTLADSEDGERIRLEYAGEADEEKTKLREAKEFVLAQAGVEGGVTRKELIAKAGSEGFSGHTIDRATRELRDAGQLDTVKRGREVAYLRSEPEGALAGVGAVLDMFPGVSEAE